MLNGENFLAFALDSLLAQDFQDYELIISDNASTDSTPEICKRYAEMDSRIRIFRNENCIGAAHNFNTVFDISNGEYFMWAAHDDLWEPSFIGTLFHLLKNDQNASLAFCAFDNIDKNGRQIKTYPDLFDLPSDDLYSRLRNYVLQEEFLGKANPIYGLIPREVLLKTERFPLYVKDDWGIDMLLVFKILSLGKLVLSDQLMFHKRLYENDIEMTAPHEQERFIEKAYRLLKFYSDETKHWHGYFKKYLKMIREIDELDSSQKSKLNKAVRLRNLKIKIRLVKELIIDFGHQILRS